MNDNNIPAGLKQAICNNQLIVFVGAGLSYELINTKGQRLKGWSNLVEQILRDLKSKGHEVDMLIPLLKKYDPIKVLDLIETDPDIPKKEINSFIKEYLELDDDKNDYKLHEKLHKLSPKLITTNYDTAFERAVPELRKYKAYKGKNYELTTHKDPNSKLLFKLHGCFEDADSMVLFPANYNALYQNPHRDAEHSLLVLKNIVLNNSILFVGTGMGDFQINNLFREIKKMQGEYNQKHFIITNKTLDSSLSFLTPLLVEDYSEIEEFIDTLASIKEECGSNETVELIALREQLLEANKKIEELESDASPNNNDLLEREALKYFSRGIEFSLSNELEKAIDEYRTALELKPDLDGAFNNWGNILGDLAQTKQGKEAEDLYQQAFDKYKKALEIKPDKHEALYNWGTYLGNLAKTKQGKEADDLYQQAFEKYKKALEIKPDKHGAFNNWGNCLGNLAQTKQGNEADDLFQQAFEKYKKALEIKPNKHEAFNNWGSDLLNLAKTKQGKEAEDLLKEAFEKLEKAAELGGGHYNLACACALKGAKKEALHYLSISLKNKEISIDFVLKDKDWKDYLQDVDFTKLIEENRE